MLSPLCKGSPAAAPCASLGVASLPSTKAIKTAIGNPVNPQTGQKVQVDLDVEPTDGPLGLEIRRHYNSALGSVNGALGKALVIPHIFDHMDIPRTMSSSRRIPFQITSFPGGLSFFLAR